MENQKRFYVFVKKDNGGWRKCDSFDTEKEAEHFAEQWIAEGKEVHIKKLC